MYGLTEIYSPSDVFVESVFYGVKDPIETPTVEIIQYHSHSWLAWQRDTDMDVWLGTQICVLAAGPSSG